MAGHSEVQLGQHFQLLARDVVGQARKKPLQFCIRRAIPRDEPPFRQADSIMEAVFVWVHVQNPSEGIDQNPRTGHPLEGIKHAGQSHHAGIHVRGRKLSKDLHSRR